MHGCCKATQNSKMQYYVYIGQRSCSHYSDCIELSLLVAYYIDTYCILLSRGKTNHCLCTGGSFLGNFPQHCTIQLQRQYLLMSNVSLICFRFSVGLVLSFTTCFWQHDKICFLTEVQKLQNQNRKKKFQLSAKQFFEI